MSLIPGIRSAVRSNANQLATSSIVLQTLLSFTTNFAANAVYAFNLSLAFSVGAAGGGRFQFTQPVGGSINAQYFALETVTPFVVGTVITAINTPFTYALLVAGTHQLKISGVAVNGLTAGSLAFQFAQNTSNATPCTILAGAQCEFTLLN